MGLGSMNMMTGMNMSMNNMGLGNMPGLQPLHPPGLKPPVPSAFSKEGAAGRLSVERKVLIDLY
jgi:hypothetical protein